jgi:hypothetical protein
MIYQLGWSTLPGLKGIGVSEFRLAPTDAPDNQRGVALEFAGPPECEAFLREIETEFAARRFTNAGDAFDAVKAWTLEHLSEIRGGPVS